MKSFLLPLGLFISVFGYGQKIFSEGTIVYQVSTSLNNQSLQGDVKSVQQIKGSHTRVELVGSVGKTTTIFNSREGEGAILQEYGTQKIMIPVTKENLQSRNAKFENIVFAYVNETKSILQYSCTKATAMLADGTQLEVYFSKELLTDNTDIGFQFGKLPGLALEYTSRLGERTVTYTAASINFEPVPIQNFDLPTSGYRLLNYEESQKKK
jgi:GLPGLI family protein